MRYRPSFYYELFEVICLETDIVRIIFYSAAAHNIKMDWLRYAYDVIHVAKRNFKQFLSNIIEFMLITYVYSVDLLINIMYMST